MPNENELDPEVSRLFAQAHEPLVDREFLAALLVKIERVRRIRLWRRILMLVAVAIIGSVNMPMVLEKTAWVAGSIGQISPADADLLVTPAGWAVSMFIGICVVLRTRPSRH